MRKQVLVLGLGRFGISLAKTLNAIGHDVLAVDKNEKAVQSISSEVTRAVQADATDEAVLKEIGAVSFDVAVVSMASALQSSVLATILLKRLGVPYVIARADNDLHGSILEKIGADKVVYVEHEMGIEVAHGLTLTNVTHYLSISRDYGVVQLVSPPHFVGKSLSHIGLGPNGIWKAAVLLIKREKEIIVVPDLKEVVQSGDILILSGNDDNLERVLAQTPNDDKEEVTVTESDK